MPAHLPTCPERTALLAQTKSHCSGAWLLMYVYMCVPGMYTSGGMEDGRRDPVGGRTQAAGALIFCLVCFSAFLLFRVSACCFFCILCVFTLDSSIGEEPEDSGVGFSPPYPRPHPHPHPAPIPRYPVPPHLQLCGVCVRQLIGVNWPIISYP